MIASFFVLGCTYGYPTKLSNEFFGNGWGVCMGSIICCRYKRTTCMAKANLSLEVAIYLDRFSAMGHAYSNEKRQIRYMIKSCPMYGLKNSVLLFPSITWKVPILHVILNWKKYFQKLIISDSDGKHICLGDLLQIGHGCSRTHQNTEETCTATNLWYRITF